MKKSFGKDFFIISKTAGFVYHKKNGGIHAPPSSEVFLFNGCIGLKIFCFHIQHDPTV